MIIYCPQFRLKKVQKHTQQQKNVVAGKNLPYVDEAPTQAGLISLEPVLFVFKYY